jgi:hypothetical protein
MVWESKACSDEETAANPCLVALTALAIGPYRYTPGPAFYFGVFRAEPESLVIDVEFPFWCTGLLKEGGVLAIADWAW